MSLGDAVRRAAFWLEVAEKCDGELAAGTRRQMQIARADLVAAVAEREEITVERAAELLAADYLFQQLEEA